MEISSRFDGEKLDFTQRVTIGSFKCRIARLVFETQVKCAELSDGKESYGKLYIKRGLKDEYYIALSLEKKTFFEVFVYGPNAKELFHFEQLYPKYDHRERIPNEIINTLEAHDDVEIVVKIYGITTKEYTLGTSSLKKPPKCNCGFISMLERGRFCSDIVFKVSGEEIKAHKVILACNSKYFEAMFSNDRFIEAKSDCIEVLDFKPDIIRAVINYIYYGEIKHRGEHEKCSFYSDLLVAADLYQLDGLKEECEQTLCTLISIENMKNLMGFALTYNAEKLQKKVAAFMCRRMA